jgi:O-antigen/teichoic acid export membrane protein
MKERARGMVYGALALMLSTVSTNILGFAFWVLVARLEPERLVGRASGEVAALILICTISQLNLTNIFIRFLPSAGHLSGTFVKRGYLAVTLMAVMLGTGYVWSGLGRHVVAGGMFDGAFFVFAVWLFAIFALQDAVLVSFRLTKWVPVENVSASALKLALIPVFITLGIGTPVLLAFVVPVVVAVGLVNYLLATRIMPKLRETSGGTLPGRSTIISFLSAEWASNLFQVATIQAMPLIVVWRLGFEDNAYFTLPWLICIGIEGLLWNISTPFVVEITTDASNGGELVKRTIMLLASLSAAAVVFCTLIAPALLHLLSPAYASHGTTVLRLVGAAVPFTAVTVLYSTFAWIDKRIWTLVAIEAASAVTLFLLSFLLLPSEGIAAVGWANLCAQLGAAILMMPTVWRRVTAMMIAPTPVSLDAVMS